MKKIITLFTVVCFLIPAISFAQANKEWQQMEQFHNFMSATFHPAEEGNFEPLMMKIDSMYRAAKNWAASPVPRSFKEKQTKTELSNLVEQISGLQVAVKNNVADAELMKLVSATHDIYHKITGECRKEVEKH